MDAQEELARLRKQVLHDWYGVRVTEETCDSISVFVPYAVRMYDNSRPRQWACIKQMPVGAVVTIHSVLRQASHHTIIDENHAILSFDCECLVGTLPRHASPS
jgi:hypothetical protein